MIEPPVARGSGNVFADLSFEDPEGERAKAQIVREIRKALDDHDLSEAEAAGRAALGATELRAILDGRVDAVSLERLIGCLRALDRNREVGARADGAPRP